MKYICEKAKTGECKNEGCFHFHHHKRRGSDCQSNFCYETDLVVKCIEVKDV